MQPASSSCKAALHLRLQYQTRRSRASLNASRLLWHEPHEERCLCLTAHPLSAYTRLSQYHSRVRAVTRRGFSRCAPVTLTADRPAKASRAVAAPENKAAPPHQQGAAAPSIHHDGLLHDLRQRRALRDALQLLQRVRPLPDERPHPAPPRAASTGPPARHRAAAAPGARAVAGQKGENKLAGAFC